MSPRQTKVVPKTTPLSCPPQSSYTQPYSAIISLVPLRSFSPSAPTCYIVTSQKRLVRTFTNKQNSKFD